MSSLLLSDYILYVNRINFVLLWYEISLQVRCLLALISRELVNFITSKLLLR